MNEMIWIQLIGFVGVILLLVMFQVNDRRAMLRIQMVSALTMALHFALLGATTGAAMNVLRSVRNYFFIRYRHKKWLLPVAVGVFVTAGVLTWHGWISVLPIAGTAIGTTALWQKNPRVIRFMSIIVPPLWFVYNYINGSYAGMVGDSITFSSILIGIIRFDILPKLNRESLRPQEAEIQLDNREK